MRMRRGGSPVAALGALLLLAGCVAIPTSGGVQSQVINADPDEVPNVPLPEGPIDGQSPLEIVQSFLSAGRGPQGGYQVAQEFLAPGTDWNGTSRVLVTSSAINPIQVDEDTFEVTVTVIGEVDSTGHYATIPSQAQTLSYDVADVDGQFRIARADPGTVVSRNAFDNAFDAYPLYYFDRSFDMLVPDLRWFPVGRSVADRIVDELLAGPTPWLGSGVLTSAFPDGVDGEADYEAPVVEVTLSADVRAESATTRLRMQQQLDASLDALGNVTDVHVTAGDLALDPAESGSEPESNYSVRYGAIGGLEGRFGEITAAGVDPLPSIGTAADALAPGAASLARDRGSVAVLGPTGVSLVEGSGDPVPVDGRPGLIAPSLDPHGFVWSVPRDQPDGLVAVGPDGEPHPLPLPVDGQVVAVEVARDGARLLVALASPNGPRVLVVGIQRGADLVPVAFGAVYDLDAPGPVVDVAWVDGSHVAVLSSEDGAPEVDVLALGGPTESLGEVENGAAIAVGSAGIRVLTTSGALLRHSDAGGWRDTGLTASFLGTQQ
jgi:hypothetical protein